ncbi:DUF5381 family protein [Bacillus weihaiensis]|uniref:YfjD family protein n=1 Tax=Bacillus weihaiensis TaxID=1547283 RepID=A0A1L3MMD9_9BACI|nr:DUF5381 family protein [Bacillus weihaiensis]APH03509.1 hypothetical protein A9C19_01365 [Bacillus weihaiensis]
MNVKSENGSLHIKGSKFMYAWMAVFTFSGIFASLFIISEGFSFESKYSLFYIAGGISLLPIFIYLTVWALPGFKPGKVLLTIIPRENGVVKSKNRTVSIKDIRNIDLIRNPLNLINDIVIESFDGRKFKIRTYNLIDELDYEVMIDKYIYPYMTDNAKEVWDRKVNLEVLLEEVKYEREKIER